MQCEKCNEKLPKIGMFCSHCGSKISKPNFSPTPKETSLNHSQLRIKSLSLKYKVIQRRKKLILKIWLLVMTTSIFIMGMAFLLKGFNSDFEYILKVMGGIFGLVTVLLLLGRYSVNNLSEKDYYKLPGSRNLKGHHRCIMCGGSGLYRRKAGYKSTIETCRCSKCQAVLFVS